MSEYIFKLPDLGEGTVESEIGEWNVKIGDVIGEDTIVGTMMTDKAAVELNSPVAGKVVSLAGEPGDMIAVGAPLVVFETDGKTPQAEADVPAEAVTAPESQSDHPVSTSTAVQNGKVITSPAIRRRAKEAGIDLSTIPGSGAGGRILRRDLDSHLDSLRVDREAAAAAAKPSAILGSSRPLPVATRKSTAARVRFDALPPRRSWTMDFFRSAGMA